MPEVVAENPSESRHKDTGPKDTYTEEVTMSTQQSQTENQPTGPANDTFFIDTALEAIDLAAATTGKLLLGVAPGAGAAHMVVSRFGSEWPTWAKALAYVGGGGTTLVGKLLAQRQAARKARTPAKFRWTTHRVGKYVKSMRASGVSEEDIITALFDAGLLPEESANARELDDLRKAANG